MGRVIDLQAWRHRRREQPAEPEDAVERLARAVERLDPLVARLTRGGRRSDRALETELLAITGAVWAGLPEEAAARAERLLLTLEGRAAHGR